MNLTHLKSIEFQTSLLSKLEWKDFCKTLVHVLFIMQRKEETVENIESIIALLEKALLDLEDRKKHIETNGHPRAYEGKTPLLLLKL